MSLTPSWAAWATSWSRTWACAVIAIYVCACVTMTAGSSSATTPRLPTDLKQWVGIPQASDPEYQQLYGAGSKLRDMQQLLKRPVELAQFWDRSTLRQGRIVENYQQVRVVREFFFIDGSGRIIARAHRTPV